MNPYKLTADKCQNASMKLSGNFYFKRSFTWKLYQYFSYVKRQVNSCTASSSFTPLRNFSAHIYEVLV